LKLQTTATFLPPHAAPLSPLSYVVQIIERRKEAAEAQAAEAEREEERKRVQVGDTAMMLTSGL